MAKRASKKGGKRTALELDKRQLLIPFSSRAPTTVAEAERLILDAAEADPRARKTMLRKVFSEEEIEAIELHHRYEIYFDPETPILRKLRVSVTTTRERADKEAARLRGMVHRPGMQYMTEDGDLVSVYVFRRSILRWMLHYRRVGGDIENVPLPEED